LARRGTFGVVCFGHCANTVDDSETTSATMPTQYMNLILASAGGDENITGDECGE
jgi:hypothetical protein